VSSLRSHVEGRVIFVLDSLDKRIGDLWKTIGLESSVHLRLQTDVSADVPTCPLRCRLNNEFTVILDKLRLVAHREMRPISQESVLLLILLPGNSCLVLPLLRGLDQQFFAAALHQMLVLEGEARVAELR